MNSRFKGWSLTQVNCSALHPGLVVDLAQLIAHATGLTIEN